jgi:hypothetical protein
MPSSQQVAGLPPLGGPGHLWALQGIVCLDLCLPDAYLPWAPQPPMIATSNFHGPLHGIPGTEYAILPAWVLPAGV